MECTCQCIIAYTGWSPECSAVEMLHSFNHRGRGWVPPSRIVSTAFSSYGPTSFWSDCHDVMLYCVERWDARWIESDSSRLCLKIMVGYYVSLLTAYVLILFVWLYLLFVSLYWLKLFVCFLFCSESTSLLSALAASGPHMVASLPASRVTFWLDAGVTGSQEISQ